MKELLKNAATILIMLALIPLAAFLFAENDAGYFSVYDKSDSGAKKLTEREYLVGALASEMPPTFHIEALKAQAAAIYTNAFRLRAAGEKYAAEIDSEKNEGYIDDKTLRERWGKSYEVYIAKMQKAVDSVLGCVVAYDGRPIVAAYHSISSGKTESAENVWGGQVPYLAAVDSSGDTYNANLESIKSIKSMDITLKTYQNPSKLKSKLKGYINSLASFEKTKYGGTLYKVSEGTSRTLELAIPPVEMTKAQSDVFKEVFDYAVEMGVNFVTRIVE